MLVLVLLALVCIVFFIFALAIIHAIVGIVLFLIVAGICAAAAEYFLGEKQGVGQTLLIGLIGAALGVVLAALLHLPSLAIAGLPIVWTIVGSAVVVVILKLTRSSKSTSLRRL